MFSQLHHDPLRTNMLIVKRLIDNQLCKDNNIIKKIINTYRLLLDIWCKNTVPSGNLQNSLMPCHGTVFISLLLEAWELSSPRRSVEITPKIEKTSYLLSGTLHPWYYAPRI